MPVIDLNTPTQLFFEWGWLLVTRANALVFLLLVVVFLVGAFVSLPGERTRAVETVGSPTEPGTDGGTSA